MSKLKINLDCVSLQIKKTIDTVQALDNLWNKANSVANLLKDEKVWIGIDSSVFDEKWKNLTGSESSYAAYCRKVSDYYNYLCKVRTLYTEMQANAIRKSKGN